MPTQKTKKTVKSNMSKSAKVARKKKRVARKKKVKASVSSTETAPTPQVVQEVSPPVVPETTVVSEVTNQVSQSQTTEPWVVDTLCAQVVAMCKEMSTLAKTITREVKNVQKVARKEYKDVVRKLGKKTKQNRAKRAPSGFAKPSPLSQQLCDFLGKPLGTEMARTEVTRLLTQYVDVQNLQNPKNRREILPDDKLSKLLNVSDSDEVTYFNLQKWMTPHFPKSKSSQSSVSVSSSS